MSSQLPAIQQKMRYEPTKRKGVKVRGKEEAERANKNGRRWKMCLVAAGPRLPSTPTIRVGERLMAYAPKNLFYYLSSPSRVAFLHFLFIFPFLWCRDTVVLVTYSPLIHPKSHVNGATQIWPEICLHRAMTCTLPIRRTILIRFLEFNRPAVDAKVT